VHGHKFNLFMNFVIIVAGIIVGIATYPGMEEDPGLKLCDAVILGLFTVEVILKIISDPFRPWDFFIGDNWAPNTFDFIIVLACMPFLPLGSAAAVLRLMRLMRVLKLFKTSKKLQTILSGLITGLKSSAFIFVLIFLIFYMFGVFGVMSFKKGDPREFASLLTAFHTLFRIATYEDWTDVMYINYYGCEKYPVGGGFEYSMNLTEAENDDTLAHCAYPQPLPITSIIYFHSFIVCATLVLLSMLVGAMAIAMINTMLTMNDNQDKEAEAEHLRSEYDTAVQSTRDGVSAKDRYRRHRMIKLFTQALGGKYETKFVEREQDMYKNRPLAQAYVTLGCKCRTLAFSSHFNNFIAFVILVAGVLVGLQTDGMMGEHAHVEWSITAIFATEALVKIAAELLEPLAYFYDSWNCFDFVIVVTSVVPVDVGGAAVIMRLLRLLRVLKLLRAFPKLQMIVVTVINSFSSIFYIGILLFGSFYIFAVASCIFFAKNDPWHFGNLHLAMFSLFRIASMEDWTDIMYINQRGCAHFASFPYDVYPDECTDEEPWGAFAICFFCVFLFLNGLILLTLFIGIISAEMENSYTIAKEYIEQNVEAALYLQLMEAQGKPVPQSEIRAYSRLFELVQEIKPMGLDVHRSITFEDVTAIFEFVNSTYDRKTLRAQFDVSDDGLKGLLLYSEFIQFMHLTEWHGKAAELSEINGQVDGNHVNFLHPSVALIFEANGPFGAMKRAITGTFGGKSDSDSVNEVSHGAEEEDDEDGPVSRQGGSPESAAESTGDRGVVSSDSSSASSDDGRAKVKELFDQADTDNSGGLDKAELEKTLQDPTSALYEAMVTACMSPQKYVMQQLDTDSSGTVSFEEFCAVFDEAAETTDADREPISISDEQIVVEVSGPKTCPKGHDLVPFVTPKEGQTCSACDKPPLPAGETLHQCSACDYRICTECDQKIPVLEVEGRKRSSLVERLGETSGVESALEGETRKQPRESSTSCSSIRFFEEAMGKSDLLEALRESPREKEAGQQLAKIFCAQMKAKWYKEGDAVYKQGDEGDRMYFVCNGSLGESIQERTFSSVGATKRVRVLERGSYFGELALFTKHGKRTATVKCESDVKLLSISRKKVKKVQALFPQLQSILEGQFDGCVFKRPVQHNILERIAKSERFQAIMLGIVSFAGLVVGLQVGYQMGDNKVLAALDWVILVLFIGEVLIKIGAHTTKPWLYFTEKGERVWNWFDFTIVVLSLPGVMGSQAGMLRLLRLARLIKIFNKVPMLKVILGALVDGIVSCCYVMLLMILCFYIYAVLGVGLFKDNDPWHFANIPLAFETLFRVATGEDWTDVWYTNYYGCGYYTGGIYAPTTSSGSALNATLAVGPMAPCVDSGYNASTLIVSSLYFLTFAMISSWILLSIVVVTILISIMKAVDAISHTVRAHKRAHHLHARKSMLHHTYALHNRLKFQLITTDILDAWTACTGFEGPLAAFAAEHTKAMKARSYGGPLATKHALPGGVWHPFGHNKAHTPRGFHNAMVFLSRGGDAEQFGVCDPEDNLEIVEAMQYVRGWPQIGYAASLYFKFGTWCRWVVADQVFQGAINVCILIASMLVGYSAGADEDADPEIALLWMEAVLKTIFLVELILKMASYRMEPWCFFFDAWNRLDFVVVVGSFLPSIGSLALLLRMTRLFRVLKALKVIPPLRMLVMVIMNSMDAVQYVAMLMGIFFYIFAIVTMVIFRANDPYHFQNLHVTLMSLFRVATGEDWTDIMYTAQYGCEEYPVPVEIECTPEAFGAFAVFYWIFFYGIGGLVMLQLFTGVVTAGMADAIFEKNATDQSVDRVHEMMLTRDLSCFTTEPLVKVFDLVDTTAFGRLDAKDLELVLGVMHLRPSEAQMAKLLKYAENTVPATMDDEVLEEEGLQFDKATWVEALVDPIIAEMESDWGDQLGSAVEGEEEVSQEGKEEGKGAGEAAGEYKDEGVPALGASSSTLGIGLNKVLV
jgi:Ca2+-binding EF-hand superfamily protein